MPYRLLADAVVLIHLGFVAFVVFGGLLVLRWHRLAWLHVPAVAWGVGIELVGGVCPLTPIENGLRAMGGGSASARRTTGRGSLRRATRETASGPPSHASRHPSARVGRSR